MDKKAKLTTVRSAVLLLCAIFAAATISGCAGKKSGSGVTAAAKDAQQRMKADKLNQQLSAAVAMQSGRASENSEEYLLGSGDLLDIKVFQVPELNVKARVNGRGSIILPLVGELYAARKTALRVANDLAALLGKKYLHDPQVSVFIDEYRAHEITVMGAVKIPSVHNVRRPRSVLEMLSMSGGLSSAAGQQIYVTTTIDDPQTDTQMRQNLVIDLKTALTYGSEISKLMLHGGDSIYVPEAGVVFVEGAVRKPGVYSIQSEMTVRKAVTLAGGALFEASEGSIQIFRQGNAEKVELINLDAIRGRKAKDVILYDGDIVMVNSNALKRGVAGFWRGLVGIVSFNRRL